MKRRVVMKLAFRGFKYYLSEAFKSIWYNKLMAITSVITVMGCLLLFGFFLIVGINVNYITSQIEGQCEVQAYVPITYDDAQSNAVCEAIKALPNVKSATLETKQQAFDNYSKSLGEDANVMEGLDPNNFLPASCRIVPEDLTKLDELVSTLKTVDGVEEVINHRETVNNVINVTSIIRKGCMLFTFMLAIIAVFIISNTIKLDVHARQREIHIMKYVGATDWFIRWPFIIEGVIVGIIGALFAILITFAVSSIALSSLTVFSSIFKLRSVSQTMPQVSGILILFGAVIGALGSLVAVRKHLQV